MKKKTRCTASGVSYLDKLTRQRLIKEEIKQATRDATLRVQADTQTQRALWLSAASVADALGIGPERMKR